MTLFIYHMKDIISELLFIIQRQIVYAFSVQEHIQPYF